MVQYVGDVAIYVTSNKLDRFDEVRSKIKETARTVASAVFTAYDSAGPKFLYDKIAVVGHSLGSVIAYDTRQPPDARRLARGRSIAGG